MYETVPVVDTKKCARSAFEIESDSEAMATGPELFICESTHQLTQTQDSSMTIMIKLMEINQL